MRRTTYTVLCVLAFAVAAVEAAETESLQALDKALTIAAKFEYGADAGPLNQISDIVIQADEIKKTKKKLIQIFHEQTGRAIEQIEKDSDRDFYMSSEQAKEYGLIDEVLASVRDEGKAQED